MSVGRPPTWDRSRWETWLESASEQARADAQAAVDGLLASFDDPHIAPLQTLWLAGELRRVIDDATDQALIAADARALPKTALAAALNVSPQAIEQRLNRLRSDPATQPPEST